jgi:membrane protein YqaA with SNARE-associated domain
MKIYKKIIAISIIVVFIAFLIAVVFFINPQELVAKIGVGNAYALLFIISFFGGFSAGGSATFISVLVTFVLAGLNPIYLGLTAGVSLAIGDMIMFYVGSKGRELVRNKWDKRIEKLSNAIKKRKWLKKLVPFIAYIYIGIIPLPNDILILFMAAIEYPRNKMNAIIFLGDLTFALMIAVLTAKGIMSFV